MAAGKTIKHMKNLSDFSHIEISSAKPFRFGIITAQWHSDVTNALYQSAYDRLKKHGALDEHIVNIPVPGSYELTSGANMLLELGQVDVVICLGCVILGETRHFDFICDAVANGLSNVSIKHNKPVIFGVLTTNNLQQALDRSGGTHGNKGEEAAIAAIQMANLQHELAC
jgi:6,7-dimethyl-8-ribityllumazine synthase